MFSCEFWELVKNTYFVEDLWTADSKKPVRAKAFNSIGETLAQAFNSIGGTLAQVFLCEFCEIFKESFFAEKFLAIMSHMMLFFSFLQISEVCSLKSIYLLEQW